MNSVKKLLNTFSQWYFSRGALPYWLILLFDCLIVVFSGTVAHGLRVGLEQNMVSYLTVALNWCAFLVFFLGAFRVMRTYRGVIRFSSFVDLIRVSVANIIGFAFVVVARLIPGLEKHMVDMTDHELIVAFCFTTCLMWAMRIIVKSLYDALFVKGNAQRVFIYGVQQGGAALARSIQAEKSNYIVCGFISDDQANCGHLLMGSKIYPNDETIVRKMRQKNVGILMVSPLKTEIFRNNNEMIDRLTTAGIKILLYGPSEEWDGKSSLSHTQLKEVEVEDLLPRNQINIDMDAIKKELTGKCIMITGAAGSIGSEIVRQVSTFNPSQLVLVDQAETPLHDIRLFMARNFPEIPAATITVSITNRRHMEAIFSLYSPQYVFHAAAYKHVPMMEDDPGEAVINNVSGTRTIADLAVKYGVEKFVMVSTDKAVNPTNVMGCSKRICEMYCQSLDRAIKNGKVAGKTQFVTTRFGNVLGSNGSVIPIFREQLKAGGPITVTHPDIIRFFMLIPEACNLVLQAATMGHGSEVYVFDMGKPVRIADLAKRMIDLSGATDVKIKYTGLRDGEKLYEEVLSDEEYTMPSTHPKVKIASVREVDYDVVNAAINDMVEVTKASFSDDMAIVRKMKDLVPEFKSKHSKYEALDN